MGKIRHNNRPFLLVSEVLPSFGQVSRLKLAAVFISKYLHSHYGGEAVINWETLPRQIPDTINRKLIRNTLRIVGVDGSKID